MGLSDARISEVLATVRLTNTGKKKAGQFSLGMKQRLGIALALLTHSKLLILDEPTNGLDPIGIQDLRELIRSFPAKGITVILSSHILSEVELFGIPFSYMTGMKLPVRFFVLIPIVLWASNVLMYGLHLILAFRFGRNFGVSIGVI